MPKGKRNAKSTGFGDFWKVTVNLSANDKRRLGGLDLEAEFVLKDIFSAVEQGYKFSMSYSQKNDTYIATLTDKADDSPSKNGVLNGYGATPINSFASLLFKHRYILEGDWRSYKPDDSSDGADFG